MKSTRICIAALLVLLLLGAARVCSVLQQPLHLLDQHGKIGAGEGKFGRGDAVVFAALPRARRRVGGNVEVTQTNL